MGLQVVTGSWYLGEFIRDRVTLKHWLTGKIERWAESMRTLAGVSCKHLQYVYFGMQKSLQQEQAFLQRVSPSKVDAFGPFKKALRENFLPAIFEGLVERAPGIGVIRLPLK